MMKSYQECCTLVEKELARIRYDREPAELYDPIAYMLSLGGKRLRPVLLLLANDLFGGRAEHALHAAAALEVFHNFTLVHDDIMDQAPLRRGKATVHEKWDSTVAILSGDLMMIKATDLLCASPVNDVRPLIAVFNKAAAEVCEGQQIDMNFERMADVTVEQYIAMITLKTAVLIGTSLKLGAMLAGAPDADAEHLYQFGTHIGVAFQVQDDILDAFGEGGKVGKKIGGDIAANKKTLLYLKALELGDEPTRARLRELFSARNTDEGEKIESTLAIFREVNVLDAAGQIKAHHLEEAFAHLGRVAQPEDRKSVLRATAIDLMQRIS